MEGIFNKLGIYDFMGVWAPGAIFCAYCNFTFNSQLQKLFLSDTSHYILLYTGIAYLLGVIFHELGKFIADIIKPLFDFNKYSCLEKLKLRNDKNSHWFIPRSFQYNYRKILFDCNAIPSVPFDKAYTTLKYTKDVNLQRVNTYHSVYALSRGILIGVIVHLCLSFVFHTSNLMFYIIFDVFLICVFFCRTVRYFINWVMNVFIQYNFINKKGKNEKL